MARVRGATWRRGGNKKMIKNTYETRGGEITGGRFPVGIEIERRDWGGTIQTVNVDGKTI